MDTIAKIGVNCVGCRSCEQVCPQKCIVIKENSEGFLYPKILEDHCIKCGLCLKRCPINNLDVKRNQPLETYALKEKDEKYIINSASGGASDLAVSSILKKGGIVYGAAYDEYSVSHIEVVDNAGRKKIQSSKYVQSDLKDTYSKAKYNLEKGKTVLFTGTPCQISGLYSFLGKKYDDLYTIDLICHGVPSPKFLKKYFEYQERKMKGRIIYYNFRSKNKRGWGTQYLYLMRTKTKTKSKILVLDKYGKNFIEGNCYRECCYQCKFSNCNRPADLTIGDFWGIEKSHPKFSSPMGVSAVMVNSLKGQKLIELMKNNADIISVSLQDVLAKQGNLIHPTARPAMRDMFYSKIDKDGFVENLEIGLNIKERIKSLIPRKIVMKLKQYIR